MTAEQTLVATAVQSWKMLIERADKFFSPLTDDQLQAEIAPGKNRLVYLWGHLIAVHDRMLPLLGIGPQIYPELDKPFLSEADNRTLGLTVGGRLEALVGRCERPACLPPSTATPPPTGRSRIPQ